jgi:hypothetical protein
MVEEQRPPFTHVYHGDYLGVIAWPIPGESLCAWRITDLSTGTILDQGRASTDEVAWRCMNTVVLAKLKAGADVL